MIMADPAPSISEYPITNYPSPALQWLFSSPFTVHLSSLFRLNRLRCTMSPSI